MPCCGGSRISLGHSASLDEPAPHGVVLVYTGQSALNVIGGATGRQYRFAGPGAKLAVDRRDAPGLQTVPNLRRVAG